MRIEFHKYTLVGIDLRRQGALLKVTFDNGNVGYADCHPWPSLGDIPLEKQLEGILKGELTPLTSRSLEIAELDAEARKNKISLFQGLKIPPSHWLIANLSKWDISEFCKFDRIKIKLGKKLESEIQELKKIVSHLTHPQKVRLDFNEILSKEQFIDFLNANQDLLEWIDYFEDPFPFAPDTWREIQTKYGIRLACDRNSFQALSHPDSASIYVVKPAIQSIEPFLSTNREIVITSYLDHPFGISTAAYFAAKGCVSSCGLLSWYAYEPSAFSRQLLHHGPYLQAPKGTGFGFDDLLEGLFLS